MASSRSVEWIPLVGTLVAVLVYVRLALAVARSLRSVRRVRRKFEWWHFAVKSRLTRKSRLREETRPLASPSRLGLLHSGARRLWVPVASVSRSTAHCSAFPATGSSQLRPGRFPDQPLTTLAVGWSPIPAV